MDINQRFGRLVLLEPTTLGKHRAWHCVCDCGTKKTVRQAHLSDQRIRSCGCLKSEKKAQFMSGAFPKVVRL
jgi:hypothetical protein